MKKWFLAIVMVFVMGLTVSAFAADIAFHGDLNNRFMLYSNHVDFLRAEQKGVLHDGTVDDSFGEIKYRLWLDAKSDDGAVKGVFATEIGGLRFGESGKMPYSGDQIQMEVRWAYLDFQLPGVDQKSRFTLGLQPFTANEYVWKETAGGVKFYGDAGNTNYELAWMRGYEVDLKNSDEEDDRTDVDAFFARLNGKPAEGAKAGIFVLYQMSDADAEVGEEGSISSRGWYVKDIGDKKEQIVEDGKIKTVVTPGMVDLDLWTLGTDGSYSVNNFFLNWDLMYQAGSIDSVNFLDVASKKGRVGDFDVSAYFAHLDLGIKFGDQKLTYTGWYASGDDDPEDDEFNAFLSTDVDRMDSICLMEGGYTDDDYFAATPYILDKGLIMNKLALDSKATDKLTVGAAVLYMMTAEDIVYTDNNGDEQNNDKIGLELDAYLKYMLYNNVEFAINAGYLFADDAMDYFEYETIRDGTSDKDIFVSTARIRYKF